MSGSRNSPQVTLPPFAMKEKPFFHGVCDSYLPRDLYTQLSANFPRYPSKVGVDGFSLFADDDAYQALLREYPCWSRLYEITHSQYFVDYCAAEFMTACIEKLCKIDIDGATLSDYLEERALKAASSLKAGDHHPTDLFVRTDIIQGNAGFPRLPHIDHRRRLVTILIYCCDAEDDELAGGDLVLHAADLTRSPAVSFKPAHNRAVGFACSKEAWHSLSPVRARDRPGRFVQITLSSLFDVWPSPGPVERFKHYVGDRLLRRMYVGAE